MNLNRLTILIPILTSFLSTFAQNKWTHVTIDNEGTKKTGILTDSGKIIVPINYDMIIGDKGFYFVKQNDLWGCYNSKGVNFIPTIYQDIGLKVSEGLVRVKKKDKWGFVDLKNSTSIDFIYDFACNFYDG